MPSYLHDIEKLASFPLSAHHPQGTSGTLKLIFLTVECCIRITVTKYYNFYQLYCQAAAKFFVNSQRKSHPRVTLRWDRVTVFEADKLYRLRRKRCRPTFKLEDKELQAILRARLEEGWSPEQIKGRESLEVSVNTIYRAVKSGRLSFEARKHLRRRGKPYKRKTRQDGRGHIKDAVSIELRPKEVEQRLEIGNWEIDTVLGKPGTGGLVTVVDRTSRLLLAAKIEDKTASAVQAALIRLLEGVECRSLTTDNGKEFARHKEVSAALGVPVYFAYPHSPWERGTNEISRRPANEVSCAGRL